MISNSHSACGSSAFTYADAFASLLTATHHEMATEERTTDNQWISVIDELLRLRHLEDDWDGAGTPAPHPSLVDYAISLALRLRDCDCPAPDRVIASVNATIYFEWHSAPGYVEIEVTSPRDAELRSLTPDSDGATAFSIVSSPM